MIHSCFCPPYFCPPASIRSALALPWWPDLRSFAARFDQGSTESLPTEIWSGGLGRCPPLNIPLSKPVCPFLNSATL